MTHDATALLARLRSEGFAVRVKGGKLLVQPISKLVGEVREAVITHRAGLIEAIQEEEKDAAVWKALDAVGAPDFDEAGPVVLETYTLLRANDDDEPLEYLAVSEAWLESLRELSASRKKQAADDAAKAKARRRAKGGRKRRADQTEMLGGILSKEEDGR